MLPNGENTTTSSMMVMPTEIQRGLEVYQRGVLGGCGCGAGDERDGLYRKASC